MPDYFNAPGAAAFDSVNEYLMNQAKLKSIEMDTRLAQSRENRAAQEAVWRQEDREKADIEKQIGRMVPGDIPPPELIASAKKHGVPLPVTASVTPQAQAQNVESQATTGFRGLDQGQPTLQQGQSPETALRTGQAPLASPPAIEPLPAGGSFKGTPEQQNRIRLGRTMRDPNATPDQIAAQGVSTGLEKAVDPYLIAKTRIAETAKNAEENRLLRETLAGRTEAGKDKRANVEVPVYWVSPDKSKVYKKDAQAGWVLDESGTMPKQHVLLNGPQPFTIAYKIDENGNYQALPSRIGATQAPPGAVRTVPPVPPSTTTAPVTSGGQSPPVRQSSPITSAGTGSQSTSRPIIGGPIARPVMGPNGQPLGSPQTTPGDQDLIGAAIYYNSTNGKLPQGMGSGPMRTRVVKVAGMLNRGEISVPPGTPNFLENESVAESGKRALDQETKFMASANRAAKIARDNLDLALKASAHVTRTDSAWINRHMQAFLKGATAQPDLTDFENKVYTAVGEYAKLRAGAQGSVAGLPISAAAEAEKLLNTAKSPADVKAAIGAMNADIDNIIKEHDAMVESLKAQLGKQGAAGAKGQSGNVQGGQQTSFDDLMKKYGAK